MTHMTEYIDKTEAMRRFKPFGREIPKEQVMAGLAPQTIINHLTKMGIYKTKRVTA